ncbi:RDD family protein [Corynebacterium comes]|nr:RDD family protein [Corynebacterium comes]
MTSPSPNLYQIHGLDRSASADELGRVIAQRDLDLEMQAIPDSDPRRRQLHTAFAILAAEDRRATYDDALDASLNLTWDDLDYLGNFGTLPDVSLFPPSQPQPAPQSNPYNYPTYTPSQPGQAADPFANPSQYTAGVPAYQATSAVPADRPGAGLRLGMMLLDGLAASMITGALAAMLGADGFLSWLIVSLVGLAYFLGFEVYTGASPVKHLFGYEVRDSTTGEKLSLEQSAKRQWWRIINIVPGIGSLIALVGMIVIGVSINPANQLIGSHDRWAGAEVVRKRGR